MAQTTKQQQVTDEKINEKEVARICERGRKELKNLEMDKQTVIQTCAKRLLNTANVPEDKISTILSRELKGFCTQQYIAKCLTQNFKDQRKVRDRSKSKKSKTNSGSANNRPSVADQIMKAEGLLYPDLAKVIETNKNKKRTLRYRLTFDESDIVDGCYKVINIIPELQPISK